MRFNAICAAACSMWVALTCVPHATADDALLTTIRGKLRESAAQIETLDVERVYMRTRHFARAYYEQRFVDMRAFRSAAARASAASFRERGMTEQAAESLIARDEQSGPSLDEYVTKETLDSHQLTAQRVLVDMRSKQQRVDQRDLRNVAALCEVSGLTPIHAKEIDQTRTEFRNALQCTTVLSDGTGWELNMTFKPDDALRLAGLPGDAFFQPGLLLSAESVTEQGRRLVTVTGRASESAPPTFVMRLLPDLGYRFERITTFNSEGAVALELQASDYRKIEGTWVPFSLVQRLIADGRAGELHEQWTVREVKVNSALAAGHLEAPSGVRLLSHKGAIRLP